MRLRVILVLAGVLAALLLLACTRDSVTLAAGVNDEPLFGTDAGDGSADRDAGRPLCVATSCPAPWATCAAHDGSLPIYACGTNLYDDVEHCGACDTPCGHPSPAHHIEMGCSSGECQASCVQDYGDCNRIPDDGCETDLTEDRANCGACGAPCPDGVACIRGRCGCPAGTTLCDGRCVDLAKSNDNCGACGFNCLEHQPTDAGTVFPHMEFGCADGQCKELRCVRNGTEFWADCNNDLDPDGCEVELRHDAANCGKCGKACEPGQRCMDFSGVTECQCQAGQTLCKGRPPFDAEFCASTETDPKNCGACGYICPFAPNAAATCEHGRCGSVCLAGTADCNGREDDGCEVDLDKDPRNCGACGASCNVAKGQPCIGGRCAMGDCDDPVTQ